MCFVYLSRQLREKKQIVDKITNKLVWEKIYI